LCFTQSSSSFRGVDGHGNEAFLIIGCMIPYWFAALTMKSVGKAERSEKI
jgi:Na+/H+-translocating membrane pyrophosphatase